MNKIVVVSLFDGLSGARVALSRVPQISVLRYYSSEVDKYAIKIANKNFPQDRQYRLGDVTKIDGYKLLKEIKKDFGEDVKIFLVGGSPCQGFSLAGRMKGSSTKCGIDVVTLEQYLELKKAGFEFDGQSYLFWEYKRLQNEINPDWFLLENVAITKKWLPMFNDAMGCKEQSINSDLVSAQSRPRYYWSNLEVSIQHKDKSTVYDILGCGAIDKNDYLTDGAIYFMNGVVKAKAGDIPRWKHANISNLNEKSYCLTASMHKGVPHRLVRYCEDVGQKDRGVRLLSVNECEMLQTLPIDYTAGVSKTQRLKAIGNGFTVDVIVEFLKSLVDSY